MARRVFFSFHYERDIWRVQQVRNSWMTQADREKKRRIKAENLSAGLEPASE